MPAGGPGDRDCAGPEAARSHFPWRGGPYRTEAGTAWRPTAFIAIAIIDPTSATLAGRTIVLLALASSPNWPMYCSATRSCTASKPPGTSIASATRRMPSAVAVATAMIASASPFGLVDLLLLARLRLLDDLLLAAFGVVDGGVARALRTSG